jgi:hypothetical protein
MILAPWYINMKNYKSFLFIQVFIGVMFSSCQNIINPKCYIALTNQSNQQVAYADVWLVAKDDSTKKIKLFEFEKLETSDTSKVYLLDFSSALSSSGYIEVNAKLNGNSKTLQSRLWEYEGDKFYFDLPVPGANLLVFSVDDVIGSRFNNVPVQISRYKKGKIKPYSKAI